MPSALTTPGDASRASNETSTRLSDQDGKLLGQLETCVERMRRHTPDEPYILTIPQDEPKYHHFSRHSADLWLAGTPFTRDEHPNVQYQTFFYHEPHSDLFHLHRRSQFEARPQTRLPDNKDAIRSNTSTPNTMGPKKRISLAAYKSKQAHAAATDQAPPTGTKPHIAKVRSDNTNKTADEAASLHVRSSTEQHHLSAVAPSHSIRAQSPPSAPAPALAPVSTKRHPSSPVRPDTWSKPNSLLTKSPEKAPKHIHLPARLSPLRLPARLSPTLPASVIASLDSRGHKPSLSDSSAHFGKRLQASADRPVSKQDSVISTTKDNHPGGASPKSASRPGPVKAKAERTSQKSLPNASSTKPDGERRSVVAPASVELPHANELDPADLDETVEEVVQSRIVKLKYSKQHRNNLRRLLQMQPRPFKDASSDPARADNEPGKEMSKDVARKVSADVKSANEQSSAIATATKRSRQDADETTQPQPKRKKLPEKLELDKRSSTPLEPALSSPAVTSSVPKSQQITCTPRKDIRTSTAMKRVESVEGLVSSTPSTTHATPSVKPVVGTVQQGHQVRAPTRLSPTSAATMTPESTAWSEEYHRLGQVAKSLKKAATVLFQEASSAGEGPAKSKTTAEKAALTYLESFSAFMLSFYCHDKSSAAREPPGLPSASSWITLHGYWEFVLESCKPYQPLYGLINHLGTVYNATIIALEGGKSLQAMSTKEVNSLHKASSLVLRAARDAEARLPLNAVMTDFPQTWQRFCSSMPGEYDTERPGHYEGGLTLPFGVHMSPLQAVRTSHAMIAEWVAGRGLEYKLKLSLSS